MTTRKHPRSRLEAWPHHYPHSIERHKRPLGQLVADYLAVVIISAGLLALLLHSLGAL